jgi:hypothetical protein
LEKKRQKDIQDLEEKKMAKEQAQANAHAAQ